MILLLFIFCCLLIYLLVFWLRFRGILLLRLFQPGTPISSQREALHQSLSRLGSNNTDTATLSVIRSEAENGQHYISWSRRRLSSSTLQIYCFSILRFYPVSRARPSTPVDFRPPPITAHPHPCTTFLRSMVKVGGKQFSDNLFPKHPIKTKSFSRL